MVTLYIQLLARTGLLLIVSIFLITGWAGCKKEAEKDPLLEMQKRLPAITSDGMMSFAVILNDKTPCHVVGKYEAPPMGLFASCRGGNKAYTYGKRADIYSTICPDKEYKFNLSLSTDMPGTYALADTSKIKLNIEHRLGYTDNGTLMQVFENIYPAEGIFRLIRADSIYAGTFSGTLHDMNGIPLKLRDGRFDIKVTR